MKTDAGKKKLTMLELQRELLQRTDEKPRVDLSTDLSPPPLAVDPGRFYRPGEK